MKRETYSQDRVIDTLQRLLAIQPTDLRTAMTEAAQLVAETLAADKVDAFLYDPGIHSLVAAGTSNTPMGHKEKALGLDRLPLANRGRIVRVFEECTPYMTGRADEDSGELPGITGDLEVRSTLAAPFRIGGKVRGVLAAASAKPDYFSEGDLRFIEAVSNWVGMVAHRAELMEQTTRKAAEQARQSTAEELITVLAHDLRNLLTPVKGRLDLIARRATREDRQQDVRDAEEASRSLARVNRLIADLMDAARLQQGVFSVDLQMADLAALVESTALVLAPSTREIRVETPGEVLVPVDPNRFRQALENLVSNALQHSPQGTAVAIQVETVERARRQWAQVSVTNEGAPIPSESLPTLFDRFATGDNSKGLGLGLYLVKGIVAAHGGKVFVESDPGRTRFSLMIPMELPSS